MNSGTWKGRRSSNPRQADSKLLRRAHFERLVARALGSIESHAFAADNYVPRY
jgi:hypothetical protein